MIMAAIGALLVMALFPEPVAGRALHRYLVEVPVRWLASIKRHQVIFALVVVAMLLRASEIIVLAGSFDLALLYASDLSLYIDAVMVLTTLAATTWIKPLVAALWERIVRGVHRPARRAAARPKCSPRLPSRAANSNAPEPRPAYALAA